MAIAIQFIREPPYSVDFRDFVHRRDGEEPTERPGLVERVRIVINCALDAVKFFFQALISSIYVTISSMGVSFKHIVLGYYGELRSFRPPADLPFAVFRVVFWFFAMGASIIKATYRQCAEKIWPHSSLYLSQFTGSEINPEHIRTEEAALDASHVPDTVVVRDLIAVFDQINFDRPEEPGYMAPGSRQEYTTVYTVEALRASLETYVRYVETRHAFLGTPPQYDTVRLMEYYKQIEDANRISLHTLNERQAAFVDANGADIEAYNEAAMREYKNLLETKNRLAIDMALAGLHCGGRFMGEAMNSYYEIQGECLTGGETLEASFVEVLAQLRRRIAEEEIQWLFGAETHAVGTYLGRLGPILAIPGSQNVTEQIETHFDKEHCLRRFFQKYTVDSIIETIQAAIKSSQILREKVIDWIRDQVSEWKIDEYRVLAEQRVRYVQGIVAREDDVGAQLLDHVVWFEQLLVQLRTEGLLSIRGEAVVVQTGEDEESVFRDLETQWPDFMNAIFVLSRTKELCRAKFPILNGIPLMSRVRELRADCSKELLIHDWKELILRNTPIDADRRNRNLLRIENIQRIRAITNLDENVVSRALDNAVDWSTVISDRLEQDRRGEFLAALGLDGDEDDGEEAVVFGRDEISKEMMEWLLVSQGILHPQLPQSVEV